MSELEALNIIIDRLDEMKSIAVLMRDYMELGHTVDETLDNFKEEADRFDQLCGDMYFM